MAIWPINRQQRQSGPPPTRSVAGHRWLATGGSLVPWLVIGIVGIVLGVSVLGISLAQPHLIPLFVLSVLCPFLAMIVGSVRRLFLAILLLDIPNRLDFNLGYRAELADLNAIAGLNISLTTISLIVLYCLWLAEWLSGIDKRSRPKVWTHTSFVLAAYLGAVTLSMVVAPDVMLSGFELFLLVQVFLLYIYIVGRVDTRQEVIFVVVMLFIGVVLESLVMIGLRIAGQGISIAGLHGRIDDSTRVGGTVGSPNTAASYLTLFLAPALAVLLTPLARPYKWLAALAFALGTIALLFTLSRGGWIAFVLSMALFSLVSLRRTRISLVAPSVFLCSILLVLLLFQNTISDRLLDSDASSLEGRLYMIQLAWKIIQDNPVLGFGANNFAVAIAQYATPDFSGAWLHVVHNKYLLVWAETGIVGLTAFLLFLVTTIRRGWQCWKLDDPLLAPLALGFIAAVVGQMGHMFLDIFHSRAQVESLWIVAGLICAMYHISRRSAPLQNRQLEVMDSLS